MIMRQVLVFAVSCSGFLCSVAASAETPAELVNPFVGTLADFGQLSPAAVAPFGMVQIGPDTRPANHAGYDFAASQIAGFSHTRAVGVGCGGAGGDVRVMLSYVGDPALAQIDKSSEKASAGYYRVTYGGDASVPGIQAEMTATRGAGAMRFTVPRSGQMELTVNFAAQYTRHGSAIWTSADDGALKASFSAGTVCDAGTYHLHSSTRLAHRGRTVHAKWRGESDKLASTVLTVKAGDTIEVQTGLSSIDPAAAAIVRSAEMGQRRFDNIVSMARANWNREFKRLEITGTRQERALFYSSLFRVMQTPVAIADPDGRFRGSDGQIAVLKNGEQHYTSWAMWDNYRTQMPLLALIDPQRAQDIARSLVRLYGSGKQRWATQNEPFLTVRTEHSGITLLDFRRKGILGFDAQAALNGMAAESDTLARGTPDEQIEAAYDDWAVAELADDLKIPKIAERHRQLAVSYRPMWLETFKNLGPDQDIVKARGLYQGTLAQYRWAAVFDLPWLKVAMGEKFQPELTRFFADNLFNMTNQPDIHVPYLLAWDGDRGASTTIVRRYLTEEVVHRYTNSAVRAVPFIGRSFDLAPQGAADGMDDDAGTMSAWYIWSTLGLYPITPGQPYYVVTKPQVPSAIIRPSKSKRIFLNRDAEGRLQIDGVPIVDTTISHSEFTTGN